LSYRVKPNCSNVNKKNLISGIRLTYKVIPQLLKENKIIFLEFLKYWPRSRDVNKLVIKAKMHAKYFLNFSLLYEDTI
jgi:hypothetical protein